MARMRAGKRRGAVPSTGHNLSDQLREIIESRGLSGYAVGQVSDVSPGVVSRFMSGQRSLSLDSVDRIARGLGLRLVEVQARRRPVRSNSRPADVEPEAVPAVDGAGQDRED